MLEVIVESGWCGLCVHPLLSLTSTVYLYTEHLVWRCSFHFVKRDTWYAFFPLNFFWKKNKVLLNGNRSWRVVCFFPRNHNNRKKYEWALKKLLCSQSQRWKQAGVWRAPKYTSGEYGMWSGLWTRPQSVNTQNLKGCFCLQFWLIYMTSLAAAKEDSTKGSDWRREYESGPAADLLQWFPLRF